jgi:hypothetical protein
VTVVRQIVLVAIRHFKRHLGRVVPCSCLNAIRFICLLTIINESEIVSGTNAQHKSYREAYPYIHQDPFSSALR